MICDFKKSLRNPKRGEKSRYPTQTIDWILKCQNKNGGFARSDLGISTFEDTYYAITILQKLTPSEDWKL
jgi:hypothetical protein